MKCVTDTANAIKFLEGEIAAIEYWMRLHENAPGDDELMALSCVADISNDPLGYANDLRERLAAAKQALADLQPLPARDTTPSIPVDVPTL